MKIKDIIICSLLIPSLTACIKAEAPNAEADIIRCILPDGYLTGNEIDYNAPYDNSLNAFTLDVEVNKNVDLSTLEPRFELTPGAVIEPASGTRHDFSSHPVRYEVTSQDGKWHRMYSVSIHHPEILDFPDVLSFEKADKSQGYYIFKEGDLVWCSGNGGYRLTNKNAPAEDYPTCYSPDGYKGGCAMLTTRTTGSLGSLGGKPIAAGNLFIGSFNVGMAMSNSLGATRFGTPYTGKPKAIEGWFKYESGPRFLEDGEYIDKVDHGNIIAILFERTDSVRMLDGHTSAANWEHPNMVAIASMPQTPVTKEWTQFHLDFDYDRYMRQIDPDKLARGGYALSLIFSSSADGGDFKGSPGSTLWIDEVRIINEK